MALQEIAIESLQFNPFTEINKEWMLITAGDVTEHNTMTASWGSLGECWGYYTSTIFLRPQRYTLKFVEKENHYSICFFDSNHRDALKFCGAHSGRDCNKDKETGLTAMFDEKAPYYKEAKLVFICEKVFSQVLSADGFLERGLIKSCYPENDFHQMYMGKITKVLLDPEKM